MASKNTTLINSPILGIILSEDVQRKNNIKIMLSTWTACFLFWFTNSSNERSFGHTFLLPSWVVCITVHVQVNFQCKYILTTFSFGYFLMESRVVIRKCIRCMIYIEQVVELNYACTATMGCISATHPSEGVWHAPPEIIEL